MFDIDWELCRTELDVPIVILAWLYSKFVKEKSNIPQESKQKAVELFQKCMNEANTRKTKPNCYDALESLSLLAESMNLETDLHTLLDILVRENIIHKPQEVYIDGVTTEKESRLLKHYFQGYLNFICTGPMAEVLDEFGVNRNFPTTWDKLNIEEKLDVVMGELQKSDIQVSRLGKRTIKLDEIGLEVTLSSNEYGILELYAGDKKVAVSELCDITNEILRLTI